MHTSLLINEKNDIHKTGPHYIAHFNNRRPMPPSRALLVLHVYSINVRCHWRNVIPLRSMLRRRNHESWVHDTHGPLHVTICNAYGNTTYLYLFSAAALLLTRFLRTNTMPVLFRTRQFFTMRSSDTAYYGFSSYCKKWSLFQLVKFQCTQTPTSLTYNTVRLSQPCQHVPADMWILNDLWCEWSAVRTTSRLV
jgi:hypothetical protein